MHQRGKASPGNTRVYTAKDQPGGDSFITGSFQHTASCSSACQAEPTWYIRVSTKSKDHHDFPEAQGEPEAGWDTKHCISGKASSLSRAPSTEAGVGVWPVCLLLPPARCPLFLSPLSSPLSVVSPFFHFLCSHYSTRESSTGEPTEHSCPIRQESLGTPTGLAMGYNL